MHKQQPHDSICIFFDITTAIYIQQNIQVQIGWSRNAQFISFRSKIAFKHHFNFIITPTPLL